MADIRGLIIPRSYNEYVNKSEPQEIREAVKLGTDDALNPVSEQPVQNKVLTALFQNDVSETNQLTTVNFVNSTVGTNTAVFRGTYESVEALQAYAGEKTNNDYAYVITYTASGNVESYKRYKYNGTAWIYEYTLNNSSFTSEQWTAINSGVTAELLEQLEQLANTVSYEPQTLTAQQQKQARQNIGIDLQAVFNVCHPIGEVYVQHPTITDMNGTTRNTVDPMTLYNVNGVTSTWVELNYDGAFFRSNGGLAETFGSQSVAQEAQLPNIKGQVKGLRWADGANTGTGAFTVVNTDGASGYVGGSNGPRSFIFSAATGQTNADGTTYVSQNDSVYKDGGEVRLANFTVRVWRRTA